MAFYLVDYMQDGLLNVHFCNKPHFSLLRLIKFPPSIKLLWSAYIKIETIITEVHQGICVVVQLG